MFTYSFNFATNYIITGVNSYKLKNNKPDFNRIAKQVWAAIGQVKLMSSYQFLFGKYGIQAGQLLATILG
jgi:Glutamate 5-kinase